MKITWDKFNGIMPATDALKLPPSFAQVAQNVDLSGGVLGAVKVPGNVTTVASGTQSVFPYNSNWLQFSDVVNIARSPIDADEFNRIYITGKGNYPKIRFTRSAVEYEYALGLPKPVTVPVCASQAKGSVTWTRTWYYQYEETNGSVSQSGSLTEGAYGGANVHEVTPGKQYRIQTIPAKTTASASAIFTMYFDAFDANGSLLGRLYPATSAYANNRDFFLSGAFAAGALVTATPSPQAVLDLTYDTSRASEYVIDRYYQYCFVSSIGEEGPLSEPSLVVGVDPTQDCALSAMDSGIGAYSGSLTYKQGQAVTQSGHWYVANQNIDTAEAFTAAHWDDYGTSNPFDIAQLRIYRTVPNSSLIEEYRRVTTFTIGTTTFTDTIADIDTGVAAPNQGWLLPPYGMKGIVEYPGGIMAGYVDNTVFLCDPYHPHAWPRSFAQTTHFPIAGLAVNSSGLVVPTTTGYPSLITGYHPSTMTQQKIDSTQTCVSTRSIAVYGDRTGAVVIYASPDGLVAVDGGMARLISENSWTKSQWEALNPSTMISEVNEGRYFGFTSSTAFIFPLTSAQGTEPTTTTQTATGLYADLETDKLYMVQGTNLKSWATGTTNMTLTFKSKKIQFTRRMSFNVLKVVSTDFTAGVTVNIYANSVLVKTIAMTKPEARRIPMLRDEKVWEFEVISSTDVSEMTVATGMSDI